MKIIIATDSYKGSCSAEEVVTTIEQGVLEVFPGAETVCVPVADGGEGTVRAMVAAAKGRTVDLMVHDPLGRPIRAEYGVLPDGTVVIETAAASGLPLLLDGERDALHASSYGTGELIRHALQQGTKKIILGLGGSATTDGGAGLAQALGVSFLDADGKELPPGGAALSRLKRVDLSGMLPQAKNCEFLLACDVRNKLCGPEGAAAAFGPQKGATAEQIRVLDTSLSHYAEVLFQQMGCSAARKESSGAAGGIGCAMMAFLNASVCPGIDLVLDAVGFDAALAGADLVLTGEGRLDAQSACGKVPAGVAHRVKSVGDIPVIAIGGAIGDGAEDLYGCGVDGMMSTVSRVTTLENAMENAVENLRESTVRAMQLLKIGMELKRNQI